MIAAPQRTYRRFDALERRTCAAIRTNHAGKICGGALEIVLRLLQLPPRRVGSGVDAGAHFDQFAQRAHQRRRQNQILRRRLAGLSQSSQDRGYRRPFRSFRPPLRFPEAVGPVKSTQWR